VALGAGFSGVIGLYMRPGPGPAGKVSANVSANDSAAAK
jgi:hypothetical protein